MVDVWLFGTFYCTNRLNTQDTKDYKVAKWRSEIKVPQGSAVTGVYVSGAQYNWVQVELNGVWQCHAIYLTDLEYQLRDTTPKSSNHLWLKFTNSSVRKTADNYLWYRAGSVIEYQEPGYNPNPLPSSANPFVKPAPTPKPLIDLGYLNFAEERLELGFDYGAVGGMAFETEIVEVASDKEQRNALRYLPLGRWQLGERTLLESAVEAIEEVTYLKAFHAARLGSFEGFRFKDWSDYQAKGQYIGTGDGVKTQFQFQKGYTIGLTTFYRPITKIAIGVDWEILIEFLPPGFQTNFVLNHNTGILTFDQPLPVGCVIICSFEFDVPVWFESDQIGFKLAGYDKDTGEAIYLLESLFVVEGRIPIENWTAQPSQQIEKPLDLGIVYETVEQYEFSTAKQELKSDYVKRDSKRLGSRKFINLGSRIYNKLEIKQILSYFWLASGRLNPFPFRNLDQIFTVRFDQDQLSLKFEGASKDEEGKVDERLFSLPGLKLQVVETVGLLKYLSSQTTVVYFCLDTSGTIDYSLPAITAAIADWQAFLTDNNFDFTFVELDYSHERWLKVVNDNFAPNALYLIWSSEAAPSYHSTLTFTPAAADFETDKNNYLANYDQRNFCKIIVHSLSMNGAAFDIFNGQLFAAKEGVLGYSPPLENYGLDIAVTIDPDTDSSDWLEYFKTEQLATNFVGAGGAPFDGLLKYVTRDTQIYFCLDTSGSIDYSLPAITAAIADWKTFLGTIYYGSDWVDTHTQTVNYTHERWLKVPNDNFAPNALYLIWSTEAAPFYHSTTSFSPAAADFLTDQTNFLANFTTRQSCKIIVHSLSLYGSDFTVFNNQLLAAKEGTSGYTPPLKNYGLDAKVTINPDTSAATWLNYFKTEAIATNFVGAGGVPPVVFPATGLVNYYDFNSTTSIVSKVGTNRLDAYYPQYPGTLVQGIRGAGDFALLMQNNVAGSIGFYGITSGGQNGSLRQSTVSLTISIWYKHGQSGSFSNNKFLFGDYLDDTNSTGTGSLMVKISSDKFNLKVTNTNNVTQSLVSGITAISGNWYNLVLTYDQATKEIKFYANNSLQISANTGVSLRVSANGLKVNQTQAISGVPNSTYDELGIWHRALTASEITDLYNNGAGTFY